jgi:hypothetical protein
MMNAGALGRFTGLKFIERRDDGGAKKLGFVACVPLR